MKSFIRSIVTIIILLFALSSAYCQITINNTLYTPTQLVDGVLVPTGSGTTISNVVFRGVYNDASRYQVGYFSTATTTLAQLGFTNGVVLTTGHTSTIPLTLGVHPGSVGQMATSYSSCTTGEIRQGGTCPAGINDLDVLAGAQNYFNAAVLADSWVAARSSGSFTPAIINGRLRMTQAVSNQSTSVTFQRLYPAANNLVVVEFDYRAYGGSGADGMALVLSDATVTPQPGAFGGPLGYGFKPGIPGFAGGWLGFGLDEFGNFSNEGGSANVGRRRQAVFFVVAGCTSRSLDLTRR